jgi:hypothetical protein
MTFLWRAGAARFPAGRCMTRQPTALTLSRGTYLSLWPVSGLATHRSRLPTRNAQWHTRMLNFEHAPRSTCMTNAVAYRCGGSAVSRVSSYERAFCFPFNCAHYDKRARAPECAQFMSGLEVRQDRLMRSLSVSVKCRLLSDRRVLFLHTVRKSLQKTRLLRLETRQLSEPPIFRAKMRCL